MRLLLFLCCLPCLLWAQSDAATEPSTSDKWSRRRSLRAGFLLERDAYNYDFYEYSPYGDLIYNHRRELMPSVVVDWALSRRFPMFRVRTRLGYNHVRAESSPIYVLDRSFSFHFRENFNYRYLQVGGGLQLDFVLKNTVSPYLNMELLFDVPLRFKYRIDDTFVESSTQPFATEITGGVKVSPGCSFGTGLRIDFGRRWLMNVGFYYTQLVLRTEWPDIEGRPLNTNRIMETTGYGGALSWQYRW